MLDDAITGRVAAAKTRLLQGGLLREIEWGIVVPQDPPDPRGRKTYAFSPIDAFIEVRTGLDRSTLDTGQADDTVLHILDPVAIFDDQLFRFGDPAHTFAIKEISGLLSDEAAGTRYASEVVLIR